MSATISLKRTTVRGSAAPLDLLQLGLLIVGLLFLIGMVPVVFLKTQPPAPVAQPTAAATLAGSADAGDVLPDFGLQTVDDAVRSAPSVAPRAPAAASLSPKMMGALDYVTRRYRVSPDALLPVFASAQLVGTERRIDPLLIVAIIGVESAFNPFAESAFGAQGLMQIVPRFHLDKLPDGTGDRSLLDPVTNIRVGVHVLQEAIQRRGSLVAGLQYYAGSSDPDGTYAAKVLAEKERLEQAAQSTRKRASVAAPPTA